MALRWRVEGAEKVVLWSSSNQPYIVEPLDWVRIEQMGRSVSLEESVEHSPEVTTAFYMVARGSCGLNRARTIIEIPEDNVSLLEPQAWSPQKQFLPRMEEAPYISRIRPLVHYERTVLIEELVSHLIAGEVWYAGPSINLSLSPQVIFTDEVSTLSWSVSNANCASSRYSGEDCDMVATNTDYAGTKMTGGHSWDAIGGPCGLQMNGSVKIAAPSYLLKRGRHLHSIIASNASGQSANIQRWLDILSIPQFKGNATKARVSGIRNALKTFDTILRNGAIINNTSLDTTVDAFKKGYINRQAFWGRLQVELENISLDTFNCKDVADKDWGAGHWIDMANEIILEWSPSHAPYLEYVIAHELMHKCGFNSALKQWYSSNQIESMCHIVSGSCFP